MRPRHVCAGLALAGIPALSLAAGRGPDTATADSVSYAVLPLRNLTADASGGRDLLDAIERELALRGARFVPDEALEAVLRPRRVRYTDSLCVADARAVGEATGARYALAGAVLDLARGSEPRVGLALRVIDLQSGERVQSAFVSLRGVDSRGLLGLGGIDDAQKLVEAATARIGETFGPEGGPQAPPPRRRAQASLDRIALLPFVNRSTRTDGGSTFAEILSHTWFQETGVSVVEASELRSALVQARIRSLQEMDRASLATIGKRLGVRWFVLGSVDRFGEEVQVRDQRYPEVEATVRVVEAETGLVVRSRHVRLRGDDGETLLRLGVERDALRLAADAARELVRELDQGGS